MSQHGSRGSRSGYCLANGEEVSFILSGYKGIDIWLVPLPFYNNYGTDVVGYRVAELVGCSFRSIWKMTAVTLPLVFVFSLIYGEFIWGLAPIPSVNYPYARNGGTSMPVTNVGLVINLSGLQPIYGCHHWEYIAAGAGAGLLSLSRIRRLWFAAPALVRYRKGTWPNHATVCRHANGGRSLALCHGGKNSARKCGGNMPWSSLLALTAGPGSS